MYLQSCCFANINRYLFWPFSLPSLSLLLKLAIIVIQKFCYQGNMTSHFSSLFEVNKNAKENEFKIQPS